MSFYDFGIISMKQIAEKYDGEVVFELNNGLFKTTIILKNRDNSNK